MQIQTVSLFPFRVELGSCSDTRGSQEKLVQNSEMVGISSVFTTLKALQYTQFTALTRQQATWSKQEPRQVVEKRCVSTVRGVRGGTENTQRHEVEDHSARQTLSRR